MTKVINYRDTIKNKEPYDIYIGRENTWYGLSKSKWANPYKAYLLGSKEEAIRLYMIHVLSTPELFSSLYELKGKTLACWCDPEPCHGDALAHLVELFCPDDPNKVPNLFDWTVELQDIHIYTDGGASPNPGTGAYAYVVVDVGEGAVIREGKGRVMETTNNRMELYAVIEALRLPETENKRIGLYTDSEYVRKGITMWIHSWIKNNWQRKEGPVMNADLWKTLYDLTQHRIIDWQWVRGHSGDKYNERCDQLVQEARNGNFRS